jgi:hypothetical protein
VAGTSRPSPTPTCIVCDGPFAKANFDAAYVAAEEARVTRGWRRLQAIPTLGLTLAEYPLGVTPEA